PARVRALPTTPPRHTGPPPSAEVPTDAGNGTDRRAHLVLEELPAALRHSNGDASSQLCEPHPPAARVPEARRDGAILHNLPFQLTSFIGRQAEMATAQQQLAAPRLVTFTGAAGCGKTRLALEV